MFAAKVGAGVLVVTSLALENDDKNPEVQSFMAMLLRNMSKKQVGPLQRVTFECLNNFFLSEVLLTKTKEKSKESFIN